MDVRPKKRLGQNFLTDNNVAKKIVSCINPSPELTILEVGPGKGILTQYLIEMDCNDLIIVEIDPEAVTYLKDRFSEYEDKIIESDFLKLSLNTLLSENLIITGNFPYNISSQILFKVFENRDKVVELVGMFQKEVAQRIAANPGNKSYGILSVLLQAFYRIEYLFTVSEHVFIPKPKVKSGVIRLQRINPRISCNIQLFTKIVKAGFNQRRKTLRNSLKSIIPVAIPQEHPLYTELSKRAEELSVEAFSKLTNAIAALDTPP